MSRIPCTPAKAKELRQARDGLLLELAAAADEVSVLAKDAPDADRQLWIEAAARYTDRRQGAVDRLARIDAALGGEAPEPVSKDALQRILEADRLLLSESARLMSQIQTELAQRRTATRAARSYLGSAGEPRAHMRLAW